MLKVIIFSESEQVKPLKRCIQVIVNLIIKKKSLSFTYEGGLMFPETRMLLLGRIDLTKGLLLGR